MNWDTPSDWVTISAMVHTSCRMVQALIGPPWNYLRAMPNSCPCIPTSISIPQLRKELPPTIELISPRTYPAGSKSVPVQLKPAIQRDFISCSYSLAQ